MRAHYSDYARHITRQYIALKDTKDELDDVTEHNVEVVSRVFNSLSDIEKEIVLKVYRCRATEINNGVVAVSSETGMMQDSIRSIMRAYERKVAIERGLIPCPGREAESARGV